MISIQYEMLYGMFYPDNWALCGKAKLGNSAQDYKCHALTSIKRKISWRDRMEYNIVKQRRLKIMN